MASSSYQTAARGLAISYIVAIVVCVVFFFVIVPILGLIFYKKRKSRLAARNRAAATVAAASVARQSAAPPPAYPMVNYAPVPLPDASKQQDQNAQFGGYYAQDGNIVHEMAQPGQQPYVDQQSQPVNYAHEQPYIQVAEQRQQQQQQQYQYQYQQQPQQQQQSNIAQLPS